MGKALTHEEFHKILSKHIKKEFPIKIKKHIDAKIKQGFVYTGGVYYSDADASDMLAIEVNLSYHPWDEFVKFTDYRWRKMCVRLADVILHEMIHMRQFRARNFKSIPGYYSTAESAKDRKSQSYFGDTDEMGAFCFNIACEMIDRFGYYPTEIKRYMDSNNASRHKNSWWYNYMHTFKGNHNHPIIIRMKHKIMLQLENAYYGKPFKTSNHLTA